MTLQEEYNVYVKKSVKAGGDTLSPELWLEERTKALTLPKVPKPEYSKEEETRIRAQFKAIMIQEGHGTVYERALYFVKGV
jgi:hypothetical protein